MKHLNHHTWIGLVLITAFLMAVHPANADNPSPTPAPIGTPTAEATLSTTPVTINITGKVSSGTAGLSIPAAQPLRLHIYRLNDKGQLVEAVGRDLTPDANNVFSANGITALPGDFAFITTTFQDVQQGSDLLPIGNNSSTMDVPVVLYAVTNDPSVVEVTRAQHILSFELAGLLQVLSTYEYTNTSDKLYLSTEKTKDDIPVSLHIPLPIGARNIAFSTLPIDRFILGGDLNAPIVEDSKPVIPGQKQEIVFSYSLPYDPKGTVPIDQDYLYATKSVEVLLPDDANVGLKTDKFDAAPNKTLNPTRPYTQYTLRQPLPAGTDLVFSVGSGKGQIVPRPVAQAANTADQGKPNLGNIALIIGAIALLAAGAMVFVQRSRITRS